MAKRRKKRRTQKRSQHHYPEWLWMLFGLAIGLSVALAVYKRGGAPSAGSNQVAQREQETRKAAPPTAVAPGDTKQTPAAADPAPPRRFDFYNMLPNFEVIIPEEEPEVEVDREPRAIVQPGVYVLQAGSFLSYDDADRRRAQLALQGIESRIQRVSIDDKTYHRVRIGPISDLNELNITRARLRQANIDVLRIRLGD